MGKEGQLVLLVSFFLFRQHSPRLVYSSPMHFAAPGSSHVGEGRRALEEVRNVRVSYVPTAISGSLWVSKCP